MQYYIDSLKSGLRYGGGTLEQIHEDIYRGMTVYITIGIYNIDICVLPRKLTLVSLWLLTSLQIIGGSFALLSSPNPKRLNSYF